MGFLAPVLLIATGALAVPLLLHLFHRHDTRRVSFPALRYLLRTEKEHARRIRFRQLLLLFLRLAAILLVVLAGARLFVRGSGSGHDPTAVAIVLDNSMSSGLVVGEERVLDVLRRMALEATAQATPDDVFWVIRAGEPWDAAPPGSASEAAGRIAATEVTTTAGDLDAALARARELLRSSPLASREIHLLSDLQATAFRAAAGASAADATGPGGELPVIVYRPDPPPPSNRYLHEVLVGGGLPPLAGQRTEISVSIGTTEPGDEAEVPLRLVIDDRIQGASSAPAGRGVTLPIGPFPEGLVQGWVETDPDALRADDRRDFAFRVLPPPVVATAGEGAFFLGAALSVLEEAGRLTRGPVAAADVLFSAGGDGLDARRPGQAAVILPPTDPTLLPAANRRLAEAGVPWRLEPAPTGGGEVTREEGALPVDLEGVRVERRYLLVPAGGEDATAQVAARLGNGDPWMARGAAVTGPYVLVGSPLDPESTTLPVSAAMVPLLEWMTTLAAGPETARGRVEAGQPLPVAEGATHVRTPDGSLRALDGGRSFRETRNAGLYAVLAGDSVLEEVPVVPPVRESLLPRISGADLEARLGAGVRLAGDPDAWSREVYVSRQGPELWRPLLALAVLLLFLEAWLAAPGGSAPRARRGADGAPRDSTREIGVQAT